MTRKFLLIIAVAGLGSLGSSASAHESRPLYVEIEEVEPMRFEVRVKTPPSVGADNRPTVSLPSHCEPLPPTGSGLAGRTRQRVQCEGDLAGETIAIGYRFYNPSVSTLVRTSWHSGATQTTLAGPDVTAIELPEREELGTVAREYLVLGVRHILEGYDHLLFLVCLLLIARTPRRIVVAVTGFTIAHSITLALSTLGLVRLPVAPVEAAIAMSIVFLAVEIARDDRQSLAYRHPITVASSFGLLHGFGFAAVLGETGLPPTEVPAALFFFNVGVELGQLAFIGAAIAAFAIASRLFARLKDRGVEPLGSAEVPAAYVVGSLASYWMLERIAGFWAS